MTATHGAHAHDPKEENPDEFEVSVDTAEKLAKNPEVFEKLKGPLVEVGLQCRKTASEEGTRWNALQQVMDLMTPEGQRAFLEDQASTGKMLMDMFLQPIRTAFIIPIELRKFFRVQFLKPEDLSLNDFGEGEIQALVAVGGIRVDESVAQAVDEGLMKRVGFLKVLSWIAVLVPDVGLELHELIGKVATIANIPAELAERLLPQVRVEVNHGAVVSEQRAKTSDQAVHATEPLPNNVLPFNKAEK